MVMDMDCDMQVEQYTQIGKMPNYSNSSRNCKTPNH